MFNGILNIFNGLVDWVIGLINGLLSGIISILELFFSMIGLNFDVQLPPVLFNVLDDITRGIGYILPISYFTPIISFMLAFYSARLIFAIYHLIARTTIKRVSVSA